MYNLKDKQRRQKQTEVIEAFKREQKKSEQEEIFNDERDDENAMFGGGEHGQMRQTQKGFGQNWKPGEHQMGDDDADEEEEGVDEDEEDDDENIDQEDDDEESDHNF